MSVENDIQVIFRRVLHEPNLELRPELSSWDVPAWDSLAHAQILLEIQSQFAIQLSSAEVIELQTVGELIHLVKAKLE